jgi:hypothetical protein
MSDTKFSSDLPELDNTTADAGPSGDAFGSVDMRALEQHMAASRAVAGGRQEPTIGRAEPALGRGESAVGRAEPGLDWRSRAKAAQMNDGTQPMAFSNEPILLDDRVEFSGEPVALGDSSRGESTFGESEGVAPRGKRAGRPTNTLLANEPAPEPIIHMPSQPMMDETPAFFGSEPIQVTPPAAQARTRQVHEPIEDAVELDLSDASIEDDQPLSETTDMAVLAEEAAALETKVLAAGAIPPERVRFTAPLEMMIEGDADLHRGAVLNMSATGIAAALENELSPGQRVWVRFRLSLADEPLSVLCTVVWRRGANATHVLYGLQFTNLSDEEAQRIDTTVRERLDGKAADWPLPLMPAPGPIGRAGKGGRTSGWTSAAFGMIGGMGLALALSALPHFSNPKPAELTEELMEAQPGMTAEALPPAPSAIAFGAQQGVQHTDAPDAIAGKVELDVPAIEPIAVEQKVAASAPAPSQTAKADASKSDAAKVVAAKADVVKAEAAKVAAAKAEAAKSASIAATAKADPKKDAPLPRKAGPDHTEVTLASGTSATKPHAFWLENPHRYVVDVPGKHAATPPAADASALVSKVRVGNYEDKTRYVFEVASNVKDARVEPRGNALVVKLSK